MIITVLTLKMMYKCVVNIHEGQGEDYLDKISWSVVLFTEVNFVKIFINTVFGVCMKVRRLMLDVDKGFSEPTIIDIAKSIDKVGGVDAFNISVNEIDMETVGMIIIVEGEDIDYSSLIKAIELTGAVVHSIDELVAGDHIVNFIKRKR